MSLWLVRQRQPLVGMVGFKANQRFADPDRPKADPTSRHRTGRRPVLPCLAALLLLGLTSRAAPELNLAGPWRFALDPADTGVAAGWATNALPGTITLPTTTDLAGFGEPESDPDPGFLSRAHKFVGAAWYQREVVIPDAWSGLETELLLERVLWQSRVWIDGREAGARDSLGTPHVHTLGALTPGRHVLAVRVDNRMIHPIGDRGHCYTEFTQSIWNGILGRIELRALPASSIGLVRVFPDADKREVRVEYTLTNRADTGKVAVALEIREKSSGKVIGTATDVVDFRQRQQTTATKTTPVPLTATPALWDEFTPSLHVLSLSLSSLNGPADTREIPFGFRTLVGDKNRLLVNGRPTFLRGNLDCAQYPLKGHPPVTVDEWKRVFQIHRDYGMNHVRYHSWCPPEAAFTAADEMGFYLLAEVLWIDGWMGGPNPRKDMDTPGYPRGVGKGDRTIDDYTRAEMRRMVDAYGNHPSFCLFAIGNELGSSNFDVMGKWIAEEKAYDPRRLYAAATARTITPACDFSDTHNIPGIGTTVNRLGVPSTDWHYDAYARAPVPIIAHEMGQMPVHPNWSEIAKYTGPLRAKNFELFRERAKASGVDGQSAEFQAASGRMNRILYKAEMEAQLRSPGCSGVSWLSLQDFPGQGEALVGWLDTFYESKGIVTPAEFRAYSAPTVPLARFGKYVWQEGETFTATMQVAHWGAQPLAGRSLDVRLTDASGAILATSSFPLPDLPPGSIHTAGPLTSDLRLPTSVLRPLTSVLRLSATIPGTDFHNEWDIWVFPRAGEAAAATNILFTASPGEAWAALEAGRRVVLAAHALGGRENTRHAAWMPLFWSWRFFPGQDRETLGAVVRNDHPALRGFPTGPALDWQWKEICDGGRGFVLNDQPADWRPIVQPVSDYHVGNKLGTVFEFSTAAGGRLLVCGYDIVNRLDQRPAARALRASLLAYAAGNAFAPSTPVARAVFDRLFPEIKPAPVAALPPQFKDAVLYVRAGIRHPGQGNTPWNKGVDEASLAAGFDYKVDGTAVWKDAQGTAWFGEKKLRLDLTVPAPALYDLYVHFHDWNDNKRTGKVVVEGREFDLGPHAGEGRWVRFDILREDALDNRLVIEATPSSGPNLQITAVALVPKK